MSICLHYFQPFSEISMFRGEKLFEVGLKCTKCEQTQQIEHKKDLDAVSDYLRNEVN